MITRYKFFFYHYSKYRLITNLNSILIRTDTYNNSNQTSFLQYLLLPACLHFGQLQLLGVRPQQRDNPMLYLLDQLIFNKILKFFAFVLFICYVYSKGGTWNAETWPKKGVTALIFDISIAIFFTVPSQK